MNIIEKWDIIWHDFNLNASNRRYALIGIPVYLFIKLLFTIPLLTDIIAAIILAICIFNYYQSWASKGALFAFILFALASWFLMTIVALLMIYHLYKYLEKRRLHKLENIAKKTVNEISGVTKSEAEVEIVIRGNK